VLFWAIGTVAFTPVEFLATLSNTVCMCAEHVTRALLDRVVAAMQAGHQKHMYTSVPLFVCLFVCLCLSVCLFSHTVDGRYALYADWTPDGRSSECSRLCLSVC